MQEHCQGAPGGLSERPSSVGGMASIALASSAGFDWRALVVGAVLTLAAQAIIQLVIVPHVDTRGRREARWEEDVLRLGNY